jgi:hypothetical protein
MNSPCRRVAVIIARSIAAAIKPNQWIAAGIDPLGHPGATATLFGIYKPEIYSLGRECPGDVLWPAKFGIVSYFGPEMLAAEP